MNRYWFALIGAALFEVGWVIGLKHAHDFLTWSTTIVAIVVSFTALLKISEKIPAGTVYAIFVGLGTVGTVLADTLLFNEPLSMQTIGFIMLLLIGVIGLKLVTGEVKE